MANQIKFKETLFKVGDSIQVFHKINEKGKDRVQIFQGIVISIRGKNEGKNFTVRRVASGNIGVERIWPLFCPSLMKIQVKKKGKVRRAKLFYLRKRIGRQAEMIKKEKSEKRKTKVKVSKSKPKIKMNEKAKVREIRRKHRPGISKK